MADMRTDGRTDGRTEQDSGRWQKRPVLHAKGARGVIAAEQRIAFRLDPRAPFPWFGGKSRAAHLIWPRFGDVPNYIEPFAGSLAVLLKRPHDPRVETVNDLDCYLVNVWRAMKLAPDQVAHWCDDPVNEADLHARHRWLVTRGWRLVQRCRRDPHYFNAKIAGWWLYGQCLWIGSGWCAGRDWTGRRDTRNGDPTGQERRPHLTHDQGAFTANKLPAIGGSNSTGNKGIHSQRRWNSGGAGAGQGVHAQALVREQMPQLAGDAGAVGRGVHRAEIQSVGLLRYMQALAERLRRVRVCCGDWKRVLTPAVTTYIGVTAVLLDPPYMQKLRAICYTHDHDISSEVRGWALRHGDDPKFRIALCGYEEEHGEHMPASWEKVEWKAGGGYGRSARGRANRHQERIWFSPHCLSGQVQPSLLDAVS